MEDKNAGKSDGLLNRSLFVMLMITGVFVIVFMLLKFVVGGDEDKLVAEDVKQPEIEQMFLSPNPFSRPQKSLDQIKGVVIHYTANPGSTAKQNREYFENLKDKKTTYASSHFIVGLDGEIIQCVPLDEIAYASNERNADTISIECCHENKKGKFNQKTYDSLVELVRWLCSEYDIKKQNVIRHYDVTGKMCPKYYVEHEDAWKKFKDDIFQ